MPRLAALTSGLSLCASTAAARAAPVGLAWEAPTGCVDEATLAARLREGPWAPTLGPAPGAVRYDDVTGGADLHRSSPVTGARELGVAIDLR